jgi:hypothetical protein
MRLSDHCELTEIDEKRMREIILEPISQDHNQFVDHLVAEKKLMEQMGILIPNPFPLIFPLLFLFLFSGCELKIDDEGVVYSDSRLSPYQNISPMDLPQKMRTANWGSGSCLHAAFCDVLRWQGRERECVIGDRTKKARLRFSISPKSPIGCSSISRTPIAATKVFWNGARERDEEPRSIGTAATEPERSTPSRFAVSWARKPG